MTPVPPTPAGSYTPAFSKPKFSRSWVARVSARSFMSSLLPKWRQPVGQDFMQAGSSPTLTRSEQSVHLNIFLVAGLNLGISNGQPLTPYPQPIQFAC